MLTPCVAARAAPPAEPLLERSVPEADVVEPGAREQRGDEDRDGDDRQLPER